MSEKSSTDSLPLNSVSEIKFYPHEKIIISPYQKLDTIRCTIDSINKYLIFYKEIDNKTKQVINTRDVFACSLEGSIPASTLPSYINLYQNSIKGINKNKPQHILTRLNDSTNNCDIIAITNDEIKLQIHRNVKHIITIKSDRVKSITFFNTFAEIRNNGFYFLTSNGNFKELISISLNGELIKAEVDISKSNRETNTVKTEFPKEKSGTIMFFDFSNDKELNRKLKVEVPSYKYFQVNLGIAYSRMLFIEDYENTSTNEYMQNLANGLSLTAGFNYYFTKHFGLGLAANLARHKTESEDRIIFDGVTVNSAADNITHFFIGLDLSFKHESNNKFRNEFNIIPGFFFYSDNAQINSYTNTFKGNNFGIQIHEKPGFTIKDTNSALYLDFSLFIGVLNNITFEGETYSLDEPSNESRLDIGIGLQF